MNEELDADRERMYQALTQLCRYPTEHLVNKWMKLAEEALGMDRTLRLISDGAKSGKRIHPLLISGWALANKIGEAEAKAMAAQEQVEATAKMLTEGDVHNVK